MDDFFSRAFGDLIGRIHGPMNVRIYIQTLVAAVLAVRAGLRDATEGNSPFLWALARDAEHRRQLMYSLWKDVGKVFAAAIVLDVVYQIRQLHTVYPGEVIVVALLLAVIPYVFLRAAVTRVFGRKKEGL